MSEEQSAPPVEVKKVKKEPKTCPLKHSNFFLTINSQKNIYSYGEQEQAQITEQFHTVVREFFNNDFNNFIKLEGSKVGEKFGMVRNAPRDELFKRITNCKIEFVFEIGPESHKLHSHGMICIAKRGVDTKLDFSAIKKYFTEKLGYEIHFHSQLFRDAKENLQEYMKKAPVI